MRSYIYWLSADQFAAFDDYFRMPIRDADAFKAFARNYIDFWRGLRPEDPAALGVERFHQQLDLLKSKGEDVDRLLLWYGAM